MAYWLGFHMCVLRHFCGGNVLVIQGGLFVKTFNKSLGQWTALIINSVMFIGVIFNVVYLSKKLGKRPSFLFSLFSMGILNLVLVVLMALEEIIGSFVMMIVFMLIFGSSFINQNWALPSEVIPANESTIPNIVQWLCLSFSNLVPPIVGGLMPN